MTNSADSTEINKPSPRRLAQDLNQHYAPGALLDKILQALSAMGKTPSTVSTEDLAKVDEFHVGGREATQHLLAPLPLASGHHILDIGCGLGGSARYIAQRFGSLVTGIDLTAEYISVGQYLNKWTGLQDLVTLEQGDAQNLPVADESFDGAYMIHVGMNIENKADLFNEIARALKSGAFIAIYDLMRIGSGIIDFPVPWSSTGRYSFVDSQNNYIEALSQAGFRATWVTNRHTYALEYFAQMQTRLASTGPDPLGIELLMGDTASVKLSNAYGAMQEGIIAPVEIVAQKIK